MITRPGQGIHNKLRLTVNPNALINHTRVLNAKAVRQAPALIFHNEDPGKLPDVADCHLLTNTPGNSRPAWRVALGHDFVLKTCNGRLACINDFLAELAAAKNFVTQNDPKSFRNKLLEAPKEMYGCREGSLTSTGFW